MQDTQQPVRHEQEAKITVHDFGLASMDRVGSSTMEQIIRIFSAPDYEGYSPEMVTFSTSQIDHVALELAFMRMQKGITPTVSHKLNDTTTVEISGVMVIGLPTKEDSNKRIGTIILKHQDLEEQSFREFKEEILSGANKVRDQLG